MRRLGIWKHLACHLTGRCWTCPWTRSSSPSCNSSRTFVNLTVPPQELQLASLRPLSQAYPSAMRSTGDTPLRNDGTPARSFGSAPADAARTPRRRPRRYPHTHYRRSPHTRGPCKRPPVEVEANALRHHLHVVLLQTRDRAVVASIGTRVTGFDARLIALGLHCVAP